MYADFLKYFFSKLINL